MNKYLEKVASSRFNNALNSAGDFAGKVFGGKARQLKSDAEVLARHAAARNSPGKVQQMAEEAAKETRNARLKASLGAGAVAGAGFLGIHKYHQHRDDAIMRKINSMYIDPNA
jgi:hypothetical protein